VEDSGDLMVDPDERVLVVHGAILAPARPAGHTGHSLRVRNPTDLPPVRLRRQSGA
jgi:hypothetical protein